MVSASGTFRSIVVPLDGSAFAEGAVPVAAGIAQVGRAAVRLVLVHRLPPPPRDKTSRKAYTAVELAVRRSERDYLRSVAARLRESTGTRVTTVMLDGAVASALAAYVDQADADLVVMTTHGRGALERALVGSVADRLVRSLNVPMLLVPPSTAREGAGVSWRAKELVAGLDGSREGETAVTTAAALARLLKVPITLVQVIVPLVATTDPPLPFPTGLDEELTEARRQEALDYVKDVAERLRGDGVTATGVAVVGATPAGTLVELGKRERGTILAVGTRGLGGVKRLMLGSVADKLVRGATVPVLVAPPARRR